MRYNAKNARCYYVTASSCGTVEFPTAYSLILPLVASCVVTRDLLRLAPDFILGLRSVCRASYVGCQPDYKHVGNHLAGREPAASLKTGRDGTVSNNG